MNVIERIDKLAMNILVLTASFAVNILLAAGLKLNLIDGFAPYAAYVVTSMWFAMLLGCAASQLWGPRRRHRDLEVSAPLGQFEVERVVQANKSA